MRESHNMGNWI